MIVDKAVRRMELEKKEVQSIWNKIRASEKITDAEKEIADSLKLCDYIIRTNSRKNWQIKVYGFGA